MKRIIKAFFLLAIVTIIIAQINTELCGENQVWSNCTTGCPARCIPDDRVCPAVCGPPGCVCAGGSKLDENGNCVYC
ncbi:chymotrypsin/elastase isoinhibitor 1 [Cephus cinctus]|uniref:Chymotrypsin/elastase isoinhibitor 1 n=1 Tax=Cephus cinctus TaxID=211228 RepID=A0AAJ7FKD2_CEPCN|nr:chymotrypsin/elastase isoinhibitor 1 [Cephus cinctus]